MKQQPVNPYLPNYEYIPDGEPYVFGNRLYIYGSHDIFNGENFCLGDYAGWSAPLSDLSDWRYEGVMFSAKQDPDYVDGRDLRLFAPDCQRGPDGRYYLYYAMTREGVIGVAVCDTPAGKYQYYGKVHYPDGTLLGRRSGDMFQYDPAVLVDDDRRVYLYSGFCYDAEKMPFFKSLKENRRGSMVIELEQDMVTVKQPAKFLIPCKHSASGTGFEGHGFFEASSIRKVGADYYFLYSSELGHELCYAVSKFPDHGFTYGGTVISNGDIGYHGRTAPLNYTGTNHGSILELNGAWYVFYHRQTNGYAFSRQGCADRIEILPDGSIPQVQMTSQGLSGAPLPGRGTYGAYIACCLMSPDGACDIPARTRLGDTHPCFTQEGADREHTPNQYLHNLRSGAVAGYRSFAVQDVRSISVTYRGAAEGTLLIAAQLNGAPVAELPISPSGRWTEAAAQLRLPDGTCELWMKYRGDGAVDLKRFTLR